MYFTPDWGAARISLRHLADYAPPAAITNTSGVVDVPPPQVSPRPRPRPRALAGLAIGAVAGLAYAARHRRGGRTADLAASDAISIAVPDDVASSRSANLAAADDGFDVTVPAASSTIDLR